MKSFAEKIIWRAWNDSARPDGTSIFFMLLRLLSFAYDGALWLRNAAYDRRLITPRRLPCPVISIGNITVGGTGKTPTVMLLASRLQQRGYEPAVLSRGYGGNATNHVNIVSDKQNILMTWKEAGDEPILIAKSLPGIPVITGPDRFLTGMAAVEKFGATVLILDDAFQVRSLFRNIDIVLLDANRPFGNGFLLPRGSLRERPSALNRADIVVWIDGANRKEPLPVNSKLPSFRGMRRATGVVSGKTGQIDRPESLKGQKVTAFSGIASPAAFRKTLADLGADVVSYRDFPDHHPYSGSDIEEIRRLAAKSGTSRLITTEKDSVRLVDFPDFLADVSLLRISMEIIPFESFTDSIFSRLSVSEKAVLKRS